MDHSHVLHSTEHARIEHFVAPGTVNSRVAFVFTPRLNRTLDGNAYGGHLLIRHGFDVIAFKNSNDDCFQTVPREIFARIDALCEQRGYTRRVAYGSSMGAFATVVFSKLLQCDTVLALSPVFSFDEAFDTRWAQYVQGFTWNYRITADSIRERCRYFFVYDDKSLDVLQVQRLAAVIPPESLSELKLPYGDHPIAHFLAETGAVKDLALSVLEHDTWPSTPIRRSKSRSKSYLQCLSWHLRDRRKLALSLAVIDRAIGIDDTVAAFHRHRSVVLEALGQLPQSIAAANRATLLDPLDPHLQNHLGHLLAVNGQADEAITAVERASRLEPTHPEFLDRLSHLLAGAGRLEEAIVAAQRAASLTRNNPHLLAHCSNLLLLAGRLQESLTTIRAAVAMDPTVAGLHRLEAIVCDHLHFTEAAVQAARQAAALEPDNPHLWDHLGHLLVKDRQPMEAVEAVKRAIELDATNALLKAFCSHIQLQSGSAHNALFYIDLAIQDDATIAMFHRHRGSVLEKLGRTEEALRAAQTAVSMDEVNLEFKGYLAHVQAQAERAPGGAAAAT